jgi:hypothetical protein
MLAIVSRSCSIVDSIAIYIWARRAGLPRQVQSRGRGTLKEETAAEQQRRCKDAGRNSSITMEFMVNAMQLSTERASTVSPLTDIFIPQKKKQISPKIPDSAADQSSIKRKRVKGIEPSCPAWEAGVLPLNYTRVWKNLGL